MKKRVVYLIVLVLTAALAAPLAGCKKDGGTKPPDDNGTIVFTEDYMVKNGISPYKVVIPAGADEEQRFAGEEFVHFFREATGAVLPLVEDGPDAGDKYVSVGRTARLADSGIEFDRSLGDDGLMLKRSGKNHYLIGGSNEGTCYAVYEYFERLFDLKIFTNEVYTLNRATELKLADLDVKEKPDIAYRFVSIYQKLYEPLPKLARMRFSSQISLDFCIGGTGHAFCYLMPASKYYGLHPEWYSSDLALLGDGGWQLCTSNPDMRAEFVKNVFEAIRTADGVYKYVSICQNDGGGFCTCEDCTKAVQTYGGYGGAYVEFGNYVAGEVEKRLKAELPERADIRFLMFAYGPTEEPPLDKETGEPIIRCADNLSIFYAPITINRAYSYEDKEHSTVFARQIEGWSKVTDDFNFWGYTVNLASMLQPFNMWGSVQRNFQDYAKRSGSFWFEEAQGHLNRMGTNFGELKTYVFSRLMWDADLDLNTLVAEFIDAYYGKEGGKYVLAYFNAMNLHFQSADPEGGGKKFGIIVQELGSAVEARYFPYGFVYNCNRLFEQALAANEALKGKDEMYETYKYRLKVEQLVPTYLFLELYYNSFDTARLTAMIDEFEYYGSNEIDYCGAMHGTFSQLVAKYRSQL